MFVAPLKPPLTSNHTEISVFSRNFLTLSALGALKMIIFRDRVSVLPLRAHQIKVKKKRFIAKIQMMRSLSGRVIMPLPYPKELSFP